MKQKPRSTDSLYKTSGLAVCQAASRGFRLLVQEAQGVFLLMFPMYHLIAQWWQQTDTETQKEIKHPFHSVATAEIQRRKWEGATGHCLHNPCFEGAILFKKWHGCDTSGALHSVPQADITHLKIQGTQEECASCITIWIMKPAPPATSPR